MNAVRKTAFAASALAITLIGSLCATGPIAFARLEPGAARPTCSISSLQLTLSAHVRCSA